jgi:hypothetical protein
MREGRATTTGGRHLLKLRRRDVHEPPGGGTSPDRPRRNPDQLRPRHVDRRSAEVIVAVIEVEMSAFPSPKHLT